MTPRQAAHQYAASLIDRQLAAAHMGSRGDDAGTYETTFDDGRTVEIPIRGDSVMHLDTFAHAPPNVLAAIERGLDREAVAEEMGRLAESLRKPCTHAGFCDDCRIAIGEE